MPKEKHDMTASIAAAKKINAKINALGYKKFMELIQLQNFIVQQASKPRPLRRNPCKCRCGSRSN